MCKCIDYYYYCNCKWVYASSIVDCLNCVAENVCSYLCWQSELACDSTNRKLEIFQTGYWRRRCAHCRRIHTRNYPYHYTRNNTKRSLEFSWRAFGKGEFKTQEYVVKWFQWIGRILKNGELKFISSFSISSNLKLLFPLLLHTFAAWKIEGNKNKSSVHVYSVLTVSTESTEGK